MKIIHIILHIDHKHNKNNKRYKNNPCLHRPTGLKDQLIIINPLCEDGIDLIRTVPLLEKYGIMRSRHSKEVDPHYCRSRPQ